LLKLFLSVGLIPETIGYKALTEGLGTQYSGESDDAYFNQNAPQEIVPELFQEVPLK